MSHKFTFTSASVEAAILRSAGDFIPSDESDRHGMTVKDCLSLAVLQVNRYLSDSGEYKDEASSKYRFKRRAGAKDDKRAEWRRQEKTAGGMSVKDSASEEYLLGVDLGWFDEHIRIVEKDLEAFEVNLPASIETPLVKIWSAALKQRAARVTPVAA